MDLSLLRKKKKMIDPLMPTRALGMWAAARKGDMASLKDFVTKGGAVNKENPMFETPLLLAAMEGREDAVELLLDAGALVNITDYKLRTPLHYAVANSHLGVVNLLLERGADPLQDDATGATPLSIAIANEDRVAEALLKSADEPVMCRQNCGQVVVRRLLKAHTQRECPNRLEACRFNCGSDVPFSEQMKHESSECLEAEISCSAACGAFVRRREMDHHLAVACPAATLTRCRFGCPVKAVDRLSHEAAHFDKPGSEWTAVEWGVWAERVLHDAFADTTPKPPDEPGCGPGAFLGFGVRHSAMEAYVFTMQNVFEALEEFGGNGRTMAQMAAHPLPVDAIGWMLKLLGVSTPHRAVLIPAWQKRCEEDGSLEREQATPSLPLAVGTITSFKIIGNVPVTPATTLGDIRRIIDTTPEYEPLLPDKYMFVSTQFYRPTPEPFEGRYIASHMGFVVLAQNAAQQILVEVDPARAKAKRDAAAAAAKARREELAEAAGVSKSKSRSRRSKKK